LWMAKKWWLLVCGLIRDVITLYQNQQHDTEITQRLGIRLLYGNDVRNEFKCGRRIFTGFNTVRIEFSDGWSERDNGYSGEKDSAPPSKLSVQRNSYFTWR
jgi:hypothetical protein